MRFNLNFSLPKFLKDWNARAFAPREDDELYANLVISPKTGEMTIDVKNGDGTNCQELTAEIEKSRGGADSKEFKPEFRRTQIGTEQHKTRSTGRNTLSH